MTSSGKEAVLHHHSLSQVQNLFPSTKFYYNKINLKNNKEQNKVLYYNLQLCKNGHGGKKVQFTGRVLLNEDKVVKRILGRALISYKHTIIWSWHAANWPVFHSSVSWLQVEASSLAEVESKEIKLCSSKQTIY